MQLTQEQIDIIQHEHGHAKVIAVAGAGKTTTLAMFIQQRLLAGANPKRMLVIMYNKSAQVDFRAKLSAQLRQSDEHGVHQPRALVSLPQVRTFHSLALKIYQGLVKDNILPPFDGELISQIEQDQVLCRLMQHYASKDIALDILNDKKKWLDPMVSFVERVKSGLDPAAVIFKALGLPKTCDFFIKVFDGFEEWRTNNRRITYSDMLYDPCLLFSRRPDLAQKYSNHMDWVLVDEYQDINPIQQFLLKVITGQRASVVAIGDPDQTIYEFRGSSSRFMLKVFDQEFPSATHYTLSKSFRYGHDVAMLSNQLILLNKQREPVIAIANEGNPDTQVSHYFQDDYAEQTLRIIKKCLKKYHAEQISILLRIWGMSAPIELALLQENIPYQMPQGNWVLERYELQTFMMLLEISAGVFNNRSAWSQYQGWLLFLTFPALKIKRNELEKLAKKLADAGKEALTAFNKMTFSELSVWQKQQLENRMSIIKLAFDKRLRANQLFNRYIRETDFYKGLSDSAFSRQQVDDRIATVQGFVRFIAKLNIKTTEGYDCLQELKKKKEDQATKSGVVISSIHRSKGLEWPVVILPGLNSNYYPYQEKGELQSITSIEGERRLFYVAMTRCQYQLHLISPSIEGSQHEQSPFITSMNLEALLGVRKTLSRRSNTSLVDISLPKALMNSVKRYSDAVNWPLRVIELDTIKPNLKQLSEIKTVQSIDASREHVHHNVFGTGHIEFETDRHFHIQFDDGQLRVLDKKISDPHLSWI